MPSTWATRRASSTSAAEQHPESDSPPQSRSVQPDDVVALVAKQRRGHRGVHAARHRNEHPHADIVPEGARRRGRRAASELPGLRRRAEPPTAPTTIAAARSTSASVVSAPIVRRSDPRATSSLTPIAARTWLLVAAPLEQLDAADTHRPASSQR